MITNGIIKNNIELRSLFMAIFFFQKLTFAVNV